MPVSLVLPCYSPQPGWEDAVLDGFQQFGQKAGVPVELIIVLDGASSTVTDAAIATLERGVPLLKVIRYTQNRGKGYATRQGVTAASGDIIIYTDVDFPYTTESIYAVYSNLLNNECDVAIGVKNDAYYANVPFMRRIISRVLRFFIRLFLSMPITDTQCGLKGFKRAAAGTFLSTTIDRYLFDLEYVYKCFHTKQYRVRAIPITLKENVRFRSMNYRILLPEMLNFVRLLFNKNK